MNKIIRMIKNSAYESLCFLIPLERKRIVNWITGFQFLLFNIVIYFEIKESVLNHILLLTGLYLVFWILGFFIMMIVNIPNKLFYDNLNQFILKLNEMMNPDGEYIFKLNNDRSIYFKRVKEINNKIKIENETFNVWLRYFKN